MSHFLPHAIPFEGAWHSQHLAGQQLSFSRHFPPSYRFLLNDLADKLAKKGTKLPVSAEHPKEASILVVGGEAPTPAKKWVHQLYQNEVEDEAHGVS